MLKEVSPFKSNLNKIGFDKGGSSDRFSTKAVVILEIRIFFKKRFFGIVRPK